PVTGHDIVGLDRVSDAIVFHAGTRGTETGLTTAGGRVLNVVGVADTLEEARADAYAAVDVIEFTGMRFRTDIADTEAVSQQERSAT
ncbi:MAG: phosphoribosylamine--glycine ligase, partial [Actinomycetia bacterium]|nr:phosphoribosylamine--glycine ligase [Actinomycetes bacterium]